MPPLCSVHSNMKSSTNALLCSCGRSIRTESLFFLSSIALVRVMLTMEAPIQNITLGVGDPN